MVVTNLVPGGVAQLMDVLANGSWHARSPEVLASPFMRTIEWLQMPGGLVFIGAGAAPLAIAGLRAFPFVSANGRKRHPVAS